MILSLPWSESLTGDCFAVPAVHAVVEFSRPCCCPLGAAPCSFVGALGASLVVPPGVDPGVPLGVDRGVQFDAHIWSEELRGSDALVGEKPG